MTDHTTHDLAIARAERDAWQSTCEELHRTIAGRDVEIEAHLGRCEAADQRARSLDAALTAEREASRGLVAQVDTLRAAAEENRGALVDVADSLHVNTLGVSSTDVATRRGVVIAKLRFELAAIRDLVAPGNPQGTVVDAVRAMATGLIESIGARDAAEQARDMARDSRDAAIARAEAAERTLSGLYDDSKAELAKLRAEVADLTVTRDRLLAREHEDGRLHAQLRAELAELRARPVLTEDLLRGALDAHGYAGLTRKLFAHIGPVTLPSPDRAEELLRSFDAGVESLDVSNLTDDEFEQGRLASMRAALAKLSPAPAPTFDAAFLRRVLVATKHGPGGRGNPGPCDAACVKCEAERMAKAAPAREVAPTRVLVHADGGACHGSRVVDGRCVGCGIAPDMQSTSLWLDADARPVQCEPAKVVAPTLVAVSDEELAVAFYSEPERPALRECIDAADLAGIRAVRAKLGAAEVTEERLREAIREERHVSSFVAEDTAKGVLARLRATAAKGG